MWTSVNVPFCGLQQSMHAPLLPSVKTYHIFLHLCIFVGPDIVLFTALHGSVV